MQGQAIVVIGGSSGALEALRTIVGALPKDLDASFFVTLHTSPGSVGVLDQVLSRLRTLRAEYPDDMAPIQPGVVYLAPPDRHLLVKRNHVRVTRGPRENRFRPAVDPLFRTAAAAYGRRVIGIVLSGGLDDGAAGLGAIKHAGGVAIVQHPGEALVPSMPEAALRHIDVDHVLRASDIPDVVTRLIRDCPEAEDHAMTGTPRDDPAEAGAHDIHHADQMGPPSPFTCPDCGGTLWQSSEGQVLQFHCHVGHRYSSDSLLGAQDDALEQALWTALRALEETTELRRRMARRAHDRGMPVISASYEEQAHETEERAHTIRRVLMPAARGHVVARDAAPSPSEKAT
jgi:two-component system chemotaxis response regulator CheB